jgi:hypothetical protein
MGQIVAQVAVAIDEIEVIQRNAGPEVAPLERAGVGAERVVVIDGDEARIADRPERGGKDVRAAIAEEDVGMDARGERGQVGVVAAQDGAGAELVLQPRAEGAELVAADAELGAEARRPVRLVDVVPERAPRRCARSWISEWPSPAMRMFILDVS